MEINTNENLQMCMIKKKTIVGMTGTEHKIIIDITQVKWLDKKGTTN
jgi:hypothetical protein